MGAVLAHVPDHVVTDAPWNNVAPRVCVAHPALWCGVVGVVGVVWSGLYGLLWLVRCGGVWFVWCGMVSFCGVVWFVWCGVAWLVFVVWCGVVWHSWFLWCDVVVVVVQ